MDIQRKVVYQGDLDPGFTDWIGKIPGGEHIHDCIQCGTCSGICPMSVYMDVTPRRLIAMANAGFKKKVLSSFTVWLCASCYSCVVNCPKDIKITDVMYAFKRRAIEEKIQPHPRFAIPILARAFSNMVRKNGRITESLLVVILSLKSGVSTLLGMAPLGLKLLKTGRMRFGRERVQNRRQIQKIFNALEGKA